MTHSAAQFAAGSSASPLAGASEIDDILRLEQAPAGVVFEIVSDQANLLTDLLPGVNSYIKRLRQRFPDLPIAIVSHGSELFTLSSNSRSKEHRLHKLVENLVNSQQISVHVCGTHAAWYGVPADAFPDYVDVTTAGPVLISDYEEMGYEVIILSE